MSLADISCPNCGETDSISGRRDVNRIEMTCEACLHEWVRSLEPKCDRCGGEDMQAVPLAIVEKGRGTQLSVVGTRRIHLCSVCDASTLERYHRNRPNPLMPEELPTLPDARD